MNYSHIISDMTWSHTRIKCFDSCPYQFLLGYITKEDRESGFFAEFGSLIHEEMEQYLSGEITEDELPMDYILKFSDRVVSNAPNPKMHKNYFNKGLEYMSDVDFPYDIDSVVWVEEKASFKIGGYPFVGVVDCLVDDKEDGLVLIDHKSRTLKKRSPRKKPTKSDLELDDYLKQLYLYCIPVKEKFGSFPKYLAFNCFRNDKEDRLIKEPFDEDKFNEVVEWAKNTIDEIVNNESWNADPEFWKCKHLCSYNSSCEFYEDV